MTSEADPVGYINNKHNSSLSINNNRVTPQIMLKRLSQKTSELNRKSTIYPE
jgi:hypothetical protein